MYIWHIEFQEHWTWDADSAWDDDQTKRYTVAAETYEDAVEKAEILALERTVKDEESGKVIHIDRVRIMSVERFEELDG